MKKNVKAILLGLLISVCALFSVACKEEEIDYTKDELTIKQTQYFDSCYFLDFFYQNEHTTAYFEEILPASSSFLTPTYLKINGEEWSAIDIREKELPYGIYEIVIEIDHYLQVWDGDVLVQEPYQKKLTLSVCVLPIFEDKYKSIS